MALNGSRICRRCSARGIEDTWTCLVAGRENDAKMKEATSCRIIYGAGDEDDWDCVLENEKDNDEQRDCGPFENE